MERALPAPRVTGYEPLIEGVALPDPHDRHVLAPAVHAGARYIVTLNQADFPAPALAPHGVRAITPDDLLVRLLQGDTDTTLVTLERQRTGFMRPSMTPHQYLEALDRKGLTGAACLIRTDLRSVWEAQANG